MLNDGSLTYDCSWPTQKFIGDGLFPYTLDYKSDQVNTHLYNIDAWPLKFKHQ